MSEMPSSSLQRNGACPDERPLERTIVRQAALWAARIQSGAGQQELESCKRWRAADPRHEIAWQRVTGLGLALQDSLGGAGAPQVREVLGRAQHNMARRGVLRGLAGLAAAGGIWYAAAPARQVSAVWLADASSGVGERRILKLEDGTLVFLNTRSAVDVRYSATARSVNLVQGEILVETAADPQSRPFFVRTASGLLQPVGTRFVVRQREGVGKRYDLAVLQGAVDWLPVGASDGSAALRVQAGEQLAYDAAGPGERAVAPRNIAAWERGMLVADNMRLDDFLAELGRYRRGWLRYDPAIASLPVVGVFSVDDTDASLQLLTQILPVRLQQRSRYWTTVEAV